MVLVMVLAMVLAMVMMMMVMASARDGDSIESCSHQSCPNLPPVPFHFVGDGDSIGDSIDDDGDGLSQMETS